MAIGKAVGARDWASPAAIKIFRELLKKMTYETFIELAFMSKMLAAFGGGFISFYLALRSSPVPSYISFVTGISFEELTSDDDSKKLKNIILVNSLMFILGFSVVFVLVLGLGAVFRPRVS